LAYVNEASLYPEVVAWLDQYLRSQFPAADVNVHDTHAMELSRAILVNGLAAGFATAVWQTYDIRVDITGFVTIGGATNLVLTECKMRPISLRDLSQLLGYCRVASPIGAFLLSPGGIGSAIRSLLLKYDRADVLEYSWPVRSAPRRLVIASWDENGRTIDQSSVLPPGFHGISM
jgi:hypothetical protein